MKRRRINSRNGRCVQCAENLPKNRHRNQAMHELCREAWNEATQRMNYEQKKEYANGRVPKKVEKKSPKKTKYVQQKDPFNLMVIIVCITLIISIILLKLL